MRTMNETMTTPSQVESPTGIDNVEKKTGRSNEDAIATGIYQATTQVTNEIQSSCGPKNAHTSPAFITKIISSGSASIEPFTVNTASDVICQAEAISDHYSISAEQFEYGIDYGYEVEPPKKTKKGIGKAHRRSSCESGIICTRIPRRSSINGGCRRRNSLDVCQLMTPDSIDEDNDCVRFTLASGRDIIHDDDRSVVSTSFASFSLRRRGSIVSSQGGDDDDKSVASAISRTSKRVRELPRDVEFDSDDSSSSNSEGDSEEVSKGRRHTPSNVPATLRW